MLSWEHREGSCWTDLCSIVLKSHIDPTKWRLTSSDPDLHSSSHSKEHLTQQPVCSSDQQKMAGQDYENGISAWYYPLIPLQPSAGFILWTPWAKSGFYVRQQIPADFSLGNLSSFPTDACKHPQYLAMSSSTGCLLGICMMPSCTIPEDPASLETFRKWSSME